MVNLIQKSRIIAVVVALPLSVLWLWIGVQIVGEQWLRLWGWLTLALILCAGAYTEHRRNVARSKELGYLLQDTSAAVVRDLTPDGQVRVGVELWSARSHDA